MEELSGDALEEGRLALLLLEKQLNVGKEREHIRTDVSVGSSRHTSQSRRKLDQAPRDIRLNNRKGSPFGLTIEVRCEILRIRYLKFETKYAGAGRQRLA